MPSDQSTASPSDTDNSTTSGLRALAVILFIVAAATLVAGIVLAVRGESAVDAAPGLMSASFLTLLGVLALMKARGWRR